MFTLATWNVRDLFDDIPPIVVGNLDVGVPWTDALAQRAARIYRARLETLARMLRRMNADVIAFQEVKNTRVLDDLRKTLGHVEGRPNGGYAPAVVGTAGNRGLRCGLLSRLPVRSIQDHVPSSVVMPVFVEGHAPTVELADMPRRGILEAVIELPDTTRLTFFVLHFKSHLPQARIRPEGSGRPPQSMRDYSEGIVRSQVIRQSEALFVRERVEQCFNADGDVQLAVAGDFNDGPDTVTLRAVSGDATLGDRLDESGAPTPTFNRSLIACAETVPADRRFSAYARGGRSVQIDHVLASRSLFSRQRDARFLNETLYADNNITGPHALASDHAPLVVAFE